jgi:hypothetical protein
VWCGCLGHGDDSGFGSILSLMRCLVAGSVINSLFPGNIFHNVPRYPRVRTGYLPAAGQRIYITGMIPAASGFCPHRKRRISGNHHDNQEIRQNKGEENVALAGGCEGCDWPSSCMK